MKRHTARFMTILVLTLSSPAAATLGYSQQATKDDPRLVQALRSFDTTTRVLVETNAPEAAIKDFELAHRQFGAGNIDGALTKLEEVMAREARKTAFRAIWANYDAIIRGFNKAERAIGFLERLVIEYPSVPDVRAALGAAYGLHSTLLLRAKEPVMPEVNRYADLGLQQMDVALILDENNFMALLGRAITYSHKPGSMQLAEQDFNKLMSMQVLRKHPWYPYNLAYYYYADALKRQGDLKRASEILKVGMIYYPLSNELKRSIDEIAKLIGQQQ